jgi:ABC-type molybdate transport system substrate-binding protein
MKALLIIAVCAILPAAALRAAELNVIAGGSMTASLSKLGPEFERTTGHKLAIHFALDAEHHRACDVGDAIRSCNRAG